jgi:hypothetical protein
MLKTFPKRDAYRLNNTVIKEATRRARRILALRHLRGESLDACRVTRKDSS